MVYIVHKTKAECEWHYREMRLRYPRLMPAWKWNYDTLYQDSRITAFDDEHQLWRRPLVGTRIREETWDMRRMTK